MEWCIKNIKYVFILIASERMEVNMKVKLLLYKVTSDEIYRVNLLINTNESHIFCINIFISSTVLLQTLSYISIIFSVFA